MLSHTYSKQVHIRTYTSGTYKLCTAHVYRQVLSLPHGVTPLRPLCGTVIATWYLLLYIVIVFTYNAFFISGYIDITPSRVHRYSTHLHTILLGVSVNS